MKPPKDTWPKVFHNGDGYLHRLDGPAIIHENGTEEWYVDGRRHRDNNLPAITYPNGGRAWFKHGRLHRLDGPAYEPTCPDQGFNMWAINGVSYKFPHEFRAAAGYTEEDMCVLVFKYGPAGDMIC